ncbi:MAG: hypothetical protein WA742_09270 [Candidatus Cybelea sp.]
MAALVNARFLFAGSEVGVSAVRCAQAHEFVDPLECGALVRLL